MDPKIVLVWTCVIIFAATGVITLLGIVKIVKIDKGFLNKLFIALLLEIVTIGVGVFNDFFETSSEKIWLVTAKVNYIDCTGKIQATQDYIDDLTIKQSSPSTFKEKSENRIRFYAWSCENSDRDISVSFVDLKNRYKTTSFNLKLDSVVNFNEESGEIDIGYINLYASDTSTYSPPSENINSTSDGPDF